MTTYHIRGRQGVGLLQGVVGADYPIINPSDDIRYLIADFFISTELAPSSGDLVALPLQIAWLGKFGDEPPQDPPTPTAPASVAAEDRPRTRDDLLHYPPTAGDTEDVIVMDARGKIVFDSRFDAETATITDTFDDRVRYLYWRSMSRGICVTVGYHTAWPPQDLPTRTYASSIFPAHAAIADQATNIIPSRLHSLQATGEDPLDQEITLVSGYNTRLTVTPATPEDGALFVSRITISAVAGAGLGIFGDCSEVLQPILSINNVTPNDAGHFYLNAAYCYYVRRPNTPNGFQLHLGNDCDACCSCQDYVDTAKYLNERGAEYREYGRQLMSIRSQYHRIRDYWLAAIESRLRAPLRLTLQPQNCPFLDVAVQYRNRTSEPQHNVGVTINIVSAAIMTAVPGFSSITSAGGRKRANFNPHAITFPLVAPQEEVTAQFRLAAEDCGRIGESPVSVEVVATVADPLAEAATAEAVLNCTGEGETADPRVDVFDCICEQ